MNQKVFEVEISPYLQITKHGLAIAMQGIPYQERKAVGKKCRYSWQSVHNIDGKRIASILVEALE
jgi:hypothetical protein